MSALTTRGLDTAATRRGGAAFIRGHGATRHGQRRCLPARPEPVPREIGVTTGLIGAAGGLGGFVLPNLLGSLKEMTGSFGVGFLVFALVGGFGGAAALAYASRGWRGIVIGESGVALDTA